MTRPQRNIKLTEKGDYLQKLKQKKQEQKQKIVKRIEKQKQINKENLDKELEDNYIEVVRDDASNIYKELVYAKSDLTDKIKKLIDGFPVNFLPQLWKGLVPLYDYKKSIKMKPDILLSKLTKGDYHTKSSKSDIKHSKTIKTVIKNFPYFKNYTGNDLTYFITNHLNYLYDTLNHIFTKKLSIPTFKSYIDTLLRIMAVSFINPKNNPIYIKYATLSKSLGNQQEKLDDDNVLNENEATRYIDWQIVLKKQKDLYDIFNKIENKNTKEAYNINLDLILISLYTLIPVLRREIFNLEFNSNDGDKSKDYVLFKRDEVKLDLNLNKKRHDPITFELEGELKSILQQSYQLYRRKYLFTDYRKYPNFDGKLTEATVSTRLRKLFISYGVNIGPSILRASFMSNWFLKNPNFTNTELKAISIKMRTSPKYLLSSYKKVISEPAKIINENIEIKQEVIEDINRIHVQKVVEDPYIKANEKLKQKYHQDDEYRRKVLKQQDEYKKKVGAKEIQKRKIISMLRHSPEYRRRITKATLERYNIDLDKI